MSGLIYTDLWGKKQNRIDIAIKRLQEFEPPEGYYFANSFGKDSTVVRQLLIMSGVKFDAHHNLTTIDPPPLIKFGKKHHLETKIHYPKEGFFKLLVKKGFPMRQKRWCCAELKERGGTGRLVITGVRHAESTRRAQRKMTEVCMFDNTKKYLHPIIDWTEADVWEFIKMYNVPYCELYDQGWKRVGCLGCPMSTNANKELEQFPQYEKAYRIAFRKMYAKKKAEGKKSVDRWSDGDNMFDWWIKKTVKGCKFKHEQQQEFIFD